MPLFNKNRVRPFAVTATTNFKPPLSFQRVRDGAEVLSNPEILGVILRQAAAETLLVAYRERFLAKLPGAVNMRLEKHRAVSDPTLSDTLRSQLGTALRRVASLSATGASATQIDEAQQHVREVESAVREALQLRNRARRGKLPSGNFRKLALEVLNLTTAGPMAMQNAGDAISLGIGNRGLLDKIQTPSATEALTGFPTTSRRNILWRQLEFGTGAFSTRPQDQGGQYRLPSGGWWYGHSPENSLHLKGSKPIAALRDPARQLPYEADSVRFRTVFARLFGAALLGN